MSNDQAEETATLDSSEEIKESEPEQTEEPQEESQPQLPFDDFQKLAISSDERYGEKKPEEEASADNNESLEESQEQSEEEIDDEFAQFIQGIPEEPAKEEGLTADEYQQAESYLDEAADAYVQMLKDSDMTDEEIAKMLGIPVEKAAEVKQEAEKRKVIKKVVLKKRPVAKQQAAKAEKAEPVKEEKKEVDNSSEVKPQAKKKIVKKVIVKKGEQPTESTNNKAPQEEQTSQDTNPFSKENLLGDKADEYVKLLKESGMSEEEIQDLLGGKK